MARRSKKPSPAEDIIDLVALAPWWVGVLLALLLYLWLHHIATQPLTLTATPGKMGDVAVRSMIHALAGYGQYFLPLLCLIGAALSAWRRRQRIALLSQARNQDTGATGFISSMSWQQFELLIGEAFRHRGYRVQETGGGGADGGVDLVLTRDGEKFLVQCKHWRAYKVGVEVARELYGSMAATGAAGGFLVTSGQFTIEAKRFAEGRNLTLIDGQGLRGLLAQREPAQKEAVPPMHVNTPSTPACPNCGQSMVRRQAKQGSRAGLAFWGCSTYPNCRGSRAID